MDQSGAQEGKSCCWLTAYVRSAIVAGVAEKHLRYLNRANGLPGESESAGRVRHNTLSMSALWQLLSWWKDTGISSTIP